MFCLAISSDPFPITKNPFPSTLCILFNSGDNTWVEDTSWVAKAAEILSGTAASSLGFGLVWPITSATTCSVIEPSSAIFATSVSQRVSSTSDSSIRTSTPSEFVSASITSAHLNGPFLALAVIRWVSSTKPLIRRSARAGLYLTTGLERLQFLKPLILTPHFLGFADLNPPGGRPASFIRAWS
ncbi:hypothetical protein Hanom_Chr15g01336991 [Helianthus anomalus]